MAITGIVIRQAKRSDINQIIEVERRAWPNGLAASKEKFISRIETFPQGNLVAEIEESIVGVVATEVIRYDVDTAKNLSWYEATDNGFIKSTHDIEGDVLFGVDLSVIPEMQNRGIASKLLEEIGKLVIKMNLRYAILGGRIPGYHKYSHEMSANDYVYKKLPTGEFLDPEVNFYLNAGLKIIRIIPNYFTDPESKDFGVLLLWKNPLYIRNQIIGRIIGRFFSKLFKVVK